MESSHIDAIRQWMDREGLGAGLIHELNPLPGGTQNLMVSFRRGTDRFVLRAPPAHQDARGDEVLRREALILQGLAKTNIPHPAFVAACWDAAVIGVPFYVMAQVDGFNVSLGMPPRHAADPALRQRMGFAFVEGAAALGRIDPAAIGLGNLGRADGFLARQVGRWRKQFESYAHYAGWPGPDELGDTQRIESWLTRFMPTAARPGIVHGDFHLGNVLFCPSDAELAAIVDWELSTLGDPLLDLGWILATWPDARFGEPAIIPLTSWQGFPDVEQLLAHYSRHSDRDLSAMDWYTVLACYKLGILLEGSHARACAGLMPRETGLMLHGRARALFRRAARIVAQS